MRFLALGLALLLTGTLPAAAQQDAAQRKPEARPAARSAAPVRPAPRAPSPKETHAAMPLAERVAIQTDLLWVGDYNGIADGDFNDRSVAAVRAFQARHKHKQTGILNPKEREQLAAEAKAKREAVGWRLIEDANTGARVGIPGKLATQTGPGKNGTRWFSAQGQLQVESFRLPNTSLEPLFEQQKTQPPDRKVEYSVLKPDFFVVSGTQGLRKFYVRAHAVGAEVRGISILYDQAMQGIMDPIVVAMSSAFMAVSPAAQQAAAALLRRKVEYGTGVVVSASGHIITDRQLVDDCQVITVAGHGGADRVAQDEASGLALLRIYGARGLHPLPLADAASQSSTVTLVGVPDPQLQKGGSQVRTVPARVNGARGMEPAPALGFAGAAVTDGRGRLIGIVDFRSMAVATGGNGGKPQSAMVPLDALRAFLQEQQVPVETGAPEDDAKASVVRVICVRK